jgi:uncharacterized protein (DUF1800 family)
MSSDVGILRERANNHNQKFVRIEGDLRDAKAEAKASIEEKLEQMRQELRSADKQQADNLAALKSAHEAEIKVVRDEQAKALAKANEEAVAAAEYRAKVNQMYKIFVTLSAGLAMLLLGGLWAFLTKGA